MKRFFAMAAALVFALGASCKSKQPKDPGGEAHSVSRIRTDSAASDRAESKAVLQARYTKVEKRLDSLWRDTLGMPDRNKKVYQSLHEMARTRRDHTQTSIALLDGPADTTAPAAWEILRARAEQSMDSLETSLFTVDSAAGSASHRDGGR